MQAKLPLAPFLLLAACHAQPAPTSSDAHALAAQVERGKLLYLEHCAKCHGQGGQGTAEGPPVVGTAAFPKEPRPGAKRDVVFRTAADVFAWTVKHMPGDAPGTLETEEYLAIFAFDLSANGVALTAALDSAKAATIVLHP